MPLILFDWSGTLDQIAQMPEKEKFIEILQELKAKGIQFALVSNNSEDELREALQINGLTGIFNSLKPKITDLAARRAAAHSPVFQRGELPHDVLVGTKYPELRSYLKQWPGPSTDVFYFDDLLENIQAAKRLAIAHVYLVQPGGLMQNMQQCYEAVLRQLAASPAAAPFSSLTVAPVAPVVSG